MSLTPATHSDQPAAYEPMVSSPQPPLSSPSATAHTSAIALPTTTSKSGVERFFDNFFREENIKWMSVVGAAIVLASSLMLVSREWSHWPVWMKYFAILAYTVASYSASSVARNRFGLETTSVVLKFLTLLLIPLCFISLSWLPASGLHVGEAIVRLTLLIPAAGFMVYSANRILNSLLTEKQPTFNGCYMLLSMAGALPACTSQWWAMAFLGGCWAVMTIGSIKVNRHIFWLTEEYRHPRVYAFFPITLLSLQFLALFSLKTSAVLPTEWLGFGLVMISATMLLTARTVAEVFRARTGNLVRPLPWNIMAPLVVGLMLLASGVIVSAYKFSWFGPTTLALIPSSLVAAVILLVTARDTGHRGFVWSGLILFAVAYQTSPVLVGGLVQQIKESAASLVREERLPLAFYGVTYLPLIIVLTLTSRGVDKYFVRRGTVGSSLFSQPVKHFVTGLTVLLFGLAAGNLKAITLVSLVDVALLATMAATFRDRRYAWGALACLVVSSFACVPCANAMHWTNLSAWHILTIPGLLGLALVSIPAFDKRLTRLASDASTPRGDSQATNHSQPAACLLTGNILAVVISATWAAVALLGPELKLFPLENGSGAALAIWIQLALSLATLLVTTFRTQAYFPAMVFWLTTAVAVCLAISSHNLPLLGVVNWLTIISVTISLSGQVILQRISRHLGQDSVQRLRSLRWSGLHVPHIKPLPAVTGLILLITATELWSVTAGCLALGYHLPAAVVAIIGEYPLHMPLATTLATLWGLSFGWLTGRSAICRLSASCTPLLGPALLSFFAPAQLSPPGVMLASLSMAGPLFVLAVRHSHSCLSSMVWPSFLWIGLGMVASLFNADLLFRIVGCTGGMLLLWGYRGWHSPQASAAVAVLINLQLLLGIASLSGLQGWITSWAAQPAHVLSLQLLFPSVVLSALVFDKDYARLAPGLRSSWQLTLTGLSGLLTLTTFALPGDSLVALACATTGFTLLSWGLFRHAINRQSESSVWTGVGAVGLLGSWLVLHGFLHLGVGLGQLALIAASLSALALHRLVLGRARYGVLARPLLHIGLICPGLLALLALFRFGTSAQVLLDPVGSLTLFAAATIYFYRALTTNSTPFAVLSLVIFNLGLATTWRGMQLEDPQYYCIPIGFSLIGLVHMLRSELPKSAHNPLRYAGALIVLVSPTFDILGGSWLHIISLLVLCILVILLAIGLRLKALVHTGTAFLLADLVMMVVQSTIDHPSLLWVSGLALGVAVICLAAYCERHRELILSRIRLLSAELSTWN